MEIEPGRVVRLRSQLGGQVVLRALVIVLLIWGGLLGVALLPPERSIFLVLSLLGAAGAVVWPHFTEPSAILDPTSMTLVTGSGPNAWFHRVTWPWDRFQCVRLVTATRANTMGKGHHQVFCVNADGLQGHAALCTARSYLAARRSAERAAAVLNVPLCDTTSGLEVTRDPGHLDEPLRARLTRLHLKYLPPPARALSTDHNVQERVTDKGVVLERRPRRFTVAAGVGVAVAAGYGLLGVFAQLFPESVMRGRALVSGSGMFLTVMVYIPSAVVLGAVLLSVSQGSRAELTQAGLRVTTWFRGIPWTRAIPMNELEELTTQGLSFNGDLFGSSLVAHSDRTTITFLKGANPDDIDRAQAHLLAWLTRDLDVTTNQVIPFSPRRPLASPDDKSVVKGSADTPADGPTCPRCTPPSALVAGTTELGETSCPRCRGQLLERDATEVLLFRQLGLTPEVVQEIAKLFGGRRVACPACTRPMTVLRVKGCVVDLCQGCGATWMDANELEAVSQGLHVERQDG
jgi:Zn-finger nucleic acid-binding protein